MVREIKIFRFLQASCLDVWPIRVALLGGMLHRGDMMLVSINGHGFYPGTFDISTGWTSAYLEH